MSESDYSWVNLALTCSFWQKNRNHMETFAPSPCYFSLSSYCSYLKRRKKKKQAFWIE